MESNWMKTKYHIILKTPQEFDNAVTFYVSTFGAQVKESFWHQGHTFCKELGIAGKTVVLSIGNGQSNADPDNNIGRLVLPTSNCELVLGTAISVGAQKLDISTVEEKLIGVKAKFVDPFGFTWLLTQGEELVDLKLGFFEMPGIPRDIQLGRSEQTESWLRMCKTSSASVEEDIRISELVKISYQMLELLQVIYSPPNDGCLCANCYKFPSILELIKRMHSFLSILHWVQLSFRFMPLTLNVKMSSKANRELYVKSYNKFAQLWRNVMALVDNNGKIKIPYPAVYDPSKLYTLAEKSVVDLLKGLRESLKRGEDLLNLATMSLGAHPDIRERQILPANLQTRPSDLRLIATELESEISYWEE